MFIVFAFLVIFIALVLTLPAKIEIKYDVTHKLKNRDLLDDIILGKKESKNKNYMMIKILYFIPICKLKLERKKKDASFKKNKKIKNKMVIEAVMSAITNFFKAMINYRKKNKFYLSAKDLINLNRKLKYKKLDLNIGINFLEPVINAYVVSFLNAFINMYIAQNINQFDLKNTYYNTYISKEIYNIKLDCIIYVRAAEVLLIVLKALVKYLSLKRKVKKDTKKQNSDKLQTI